MYHYIYKTTNLLNGCYYIGCHSTRKLDNSYLGSGIYLNRSIKKYGENNFRKEIWFLCPNKETKFNCEKWIVTEELLKDPLCMNLKGGGSGGNGGANKGYTPWNKNKKCPQISEKLKGIIPWNKGLNGIDSLETRRKKGAAKKGHKPWNKGLSNCYTTEHIKELSEKMAGKNNPNYGKKMSDIVKEKISKSLRRCNSMVE